MFVYCLQCLTHRCDRIAQLLELKNAGRAISPKILQRHVKNGKVIDGYYNLLPGYVLLYSEEPVNTYLYRSQIDGIIHTLGYGDFDRPLRGRDMEFAMEIYRMDGKIGELTAIREGDRARVEDNLFSAYEGKVEKIDFRKGRAKVSFEFDGQERSVWVACNILTKIDQTLTKNA